MQTLALDRQLESDYVALETEEFHMFNQQMISLDCESTITIV